MAHALPVLVLLFAVLAPPPAAEARGGRLEHLPQPPLGRGEMMARLVPPPPPDRPPHTATPRTPTITTPDLGQTPRPRPASYEDWGVWYAHNREGIERLKYTVFPIGGSNPLFLGAEQPPWARATASQRLARKRVEERGRPALLRTLDGNAAPVVARAGAILALAKIAWKAGDVEQIRHALDEGVESDPIVQESAALALGLLRRADPVHQFTARELDKVRKCLFGVFENDAHQARTRGFAAISLGLLGDQPTGSGTYSGDANAAARATTVRLFELLKASYTNQDLYVGLLLAIGMQPHTSVTREEREILANAALRGRLYDSTANDLIRAHAAHTLGKIGTRADITTLENVLAARRGVANNVRRSAAIGLGLLGRRAAGEARVDIAKVLIKTVEKLKDNSTQNFALVSIAYLLIDDIRSGTTDVLASTQADEVLLRVAERGAYVHKPFGALALGLVLRSIHDELQIHEYQEFKSRALRILREGVAGKKMDMQTRGAFCTAVGLAGDGASGEALRAIVKDAEAHYTLRADAARGLGLIGNPTAEARTCLADALVESSSATLRRQAAIGLGLLGNHRIPGRGKTPCELLLDLLADAPLPAEKGRLVLLLGQVGDHSAAAPLVRILDDAEAEPALRARAAAALGQVGDLEFPASLDPIRRDANYRAWSDLTRVLFDLL